jgi:SNF2 family DNA or RNA helicase
MFKPHDYQADAIRFLLKNPSGGVFADPGLGKTAIILSIINTFKKLGRKKPWLIVAPLRVCYSVWPAEIKKWNFNLTICNLHVEPWKPADIYTINPESLVKQLQAFENSPHWPFFGLCIDESTKFKKATGKRFRHLRKHLPKFKKRIILTGTPTPNSLLDLFGQIYILDLGASLGKYITHYRNTYFYRTGYMGYQWAPFEQSSKFIYKKLQPITYRIDAETYLDLPPLLLNDVAVELPEEARSIYRSLEKEFFAELDGGESITVGSAASKYNALRQVVNGGLFEQAPIEMMKKRKAHQLHTVKNEAVVELVESLQGKPVLIAYHYQHDLTRLISLFPEAPFIGGGQKALKSRQIIEDWNKGKIPILIGHPQSMGHGLNLQSAGNDIIWYSLTDNLESYEQFNRRIYRQGVNGQVRIHRIIADNTIDEALIKMLDKKAGSQRALLNALKEYRINGRKH